MGVAYSLKEKHKDYILIEEWNGIKLPSFDFGNSPSQIKDIDFSRKTVILTTSCGTQGIVNAINADEIITGSLVNASAIAKYIKQNNFNEVSIVNMSRPNEFPSDENELCAKYIKSLLEDTLLENLEDKVEQLKLTSGKKFFDTSKEEFFPKEDFYLCVEINKFDFILKVKKDINEMLYMEKI